MPADDDPDHARSAPTVQLFIDRARRAGALSVIDDDTLVDIARLVRQLDGMPLAIELAADADPSTQPAPDLGAARRRTRAPAPPRQRSRSPREHAAVIAASYEPLAPHVQAGFRALCVFNAPFDLELARRLMDVPTELDAVEIATELIDASLLVTMVDQGVSNRYRLLEPIRLFGLERLEADGEMTATVERFVDVLATYADTFVAKVLTQFSPQLFTTVTERFARSDPRHRRVPPPRWHGRRAEPALPAAVRSAPNRGEQIALARRGSSAHGTTEHHSTSKRWR